MNAFESTTVQRVLLVGNNPIELSDIHETMKKSRKVQFESDFVFDVGDLAKRLSRFNPDYIVIDDNLGKKDLNRVFKLLRNDSATASIPITIVQNSNIDNLPREGADEFILKNNVTPKSLTRALFNSLKVHEMRNYLRQSYLKRKQKLAFK